MLTVIPPEIKDDDFYFSIIDVIKNNSEQINNIIEIGASSGDGSTEALIKGISETGKNIQLYSIEINKDRFSNLKNRYQHLSNFHPINISSIKLEDYPTIDDVSSFYNNVKTKLNNFPLDMVLGWLKEETGYIKENNIEDDGIELIKTKFGINNFDLVLIDGSPFTGLIEFNKLCSSKFILLDDIVDIKNYYPHKIMSENCNYELIKENKVLRNGFSIWKNKKYV